MASDSFAMTIEGAEEVEPKKVKDASLETFDIRGVLPVTF